MPETTSDINGLIILYLFGMIEPEEQVTLDAWLAAREGRREWLNTFVNTDRLSRELLELDEQEQSWNWLVKEIRTHNSENPHPHEKPGASRWYAMAIAASILLILAVGSVYFFLSRSGKGIAVHQTSRQKPEGPGHLQWETLPTRQGGAFLTFDDGRRVNLDTAGMISDEGNIVFEARQNELLWGKSDDPSGRVVPAVLITTGRGRSYRLNMPDGTKILLNASTALRLPAAFGSRGRRLELLRGEASFEVEHLAGPSDFIVQIPSPFQASDTGKGLEVRAIGTNFNVQAYPEDSVSRVTLLKGAITINKPGSGLLTLLPAQQYCLAGNGIGRTVPVDKAGLQAIIAWQKGSFRFENAPIREVLAELQRWYNKEIILKDTIGVHFYTPSWSRNTSLDTVLSMLERTRILSVRHEDDKFIITRRSDTISR